MPWIARNAISSRIVCDSPASADPMRKMTIEASKNVLRPYRSPSLPHSGVDTVDASRYAVTTQDRWDSPCRSPAIVGSAVATIVWSSAASSIPSSSAPMMISVRRWLSSLCSCAATAPPRTRSSNIIAEPRLSARGGRAAAYVVPVTTAVESMVAVTYVRDIGASRAFYELLGFGEHSSGKADTSAWLALHRDGHYVQLASTRPPLDLPRLPLLFYFFLDDLDAVTGALGAAGVEVTHMGRPPHALGGEVKLLDPDGNTILLGQRERSASQPPAADDEASPHFSPLREAAALVEARGGTTLMCQISDAGGADRK